MTAMPYRRRMFRRRGGRQRLTNSVTHVPSSMNGVLQPSTSSTVIAAQAGNFNTTGDALSGDTFENADRLTTVQIGAKIFNIIYNLGIRDLTGDGIIEWAILKIERSPVVPTQGSGLPTNAEITTIGLQAAVRQYQPGRVLKFGTIAVAAEQPRTISLKGNYSKFRFTTMRTGDFYCIMIFNRSETAITLDTQMRFKAFQ